MTARPRNASKLRHREREFSAVNTRNISGKPRKIAQLASQFFHDCWLRRAEDSARGRRVAILRRRTRKWLFTGNLQLPREKNRWDLDACRVLGGWPLRVDCGRE